MGKCGSCGERLSFGGSGLARRAVEYNEWVMTLDGATKQARAELRLDESDEGVVEATELVTEAGRHYRDMVHAAAHRQHQGTLPFDELRVWQEHCERGILLMLELFSAAGVEPTFFSDDVGFAE